jgi:hypothetical protein
MDLSGFSWFTAKAPNYASLPEGELFKLIKAYKLRE